MAGFFTSSQNSLKFIYERLMQYLFILGLPLTVGTMLLSDQIILLIYGDQFVPSIAALQILAWDIILFFTYVSLGTILQAINKQNQVAIAAGVCAVINVILNIILIPYFSYIGAAIATIATETVLCGLYFYFVSKYLHRMPLHKLIIKPLIACSAMVLLIYFCGGINVAVLVISAALLYFVVLYLIKGFSKEDFDLLRQALRYPK